jgi:RimJ/RimL family protein N-acetyltransferase
MLVIPAKAGIHEHRRRRPSLVRVHGSRIKSGMTGSGGADIATLGAPMGEGDLSLEPMAETHREALKAACAQDGEIWSIYATSYDPDHFDAAFDLIRSRPSWRCFSIFLGGELVGMSCFLGIDPERAALEIGNTYYVPRLRGTGFNQRVKDLMLARAFGCEFRRVEFRVDARNGRSQAAMARIGGVREGVLRQDRITWTGHVRDTVLFSILADEWKAADDS